MRGRCRIALAVEDLHFPYTGMADDALSVTGGQLPVAGTERWLGPVRGA